MVDGDSGRSKVTRLILEWAGASVLEVGSGAAAITALEHGHFDAVCLDLSLHDVAGLALLPEVRRRQQPLIRSGPLGGLGAFSTPTAMSTGSSLVVSKFPWSSSP